MHAAICDFILDVVQNSVEAGARIIELDLREEGGAISVRLTDDGRGMTDTELAEALNPFYTDGTKHAARRVGLGLPFLSQAVEAVGGEFSVRSRKGEGTELWFSFPAGHLDTPPLGDVSSLIRSTMVFGGGYELRVRRCREKDRKAAGLEYELSRSELVEAVGGDLSSASSLILLGRYLESLEDSV